MFCFIDYRTTLEERLNLEKHGLYCIEVPPYPILYPAIDGHVDIQLNILDKHTKKIIIHNNMNEDFKGLLISNKINFIESFSNLGEKYPNNVILNALILDKYFIHNLNATDKTLLDNQCNKTLINVKQGYTKCSCLPINENALITNDCKIYEVLTKKNFDVLLLPHGDIELPGLNYGFIGGVGGMISNNTLALFGSLDYYKFGNEIKKFLYKYDVSPLYLRKGKLIDRGSLLTF